MFRTTLRVLALAPVMAGPAPAFAESVASGVERRDTDMKGPGDLDAAATEANRYAVFEIKGVEVIQLEADLIFVR